MGISTKIAGTGSGVPTTLHDNAEVARRLNIDSDYIWRMSGIRKRHWVKAGETCVGLAEQASRRALETAGITATSLDAILVSTTSPDRIFPSTACLLQHRLGLRRTAAFDLGASCSGFLYGLSMADAMIQSGSFHRCLVVCAEVKSRFLNPRDVGTSILFGDGAGAAVVVRGTKEEGGILKLRLFADGGYRDLVSIPAGGSRCPTSQETVSKGLHTLQLRGGTLFRVAVKRLSLAIRTLLEEEHLSLEEIQHAVFHQANGRMLNQIIGRLGLPRERLVSVIERFGNTSSASLPMALDEANREGKFKPGDLVLLGTFGGGLTWGAGLVRWG